MDNSLTFVSIPTLKLKLSKQYQHNASQDAYIDEKYVKDVLKNISTHTLTYLHPTANTATHKAEYTETKKHYTALVDTATTHNYLEDEATKCCDKLKPAYGPNVKVANGNIITLTQQGTLRLSNKLSPEAQHS